MAASPNYKVYSASKEYMAACKEIEGAAALVSFYGAGATIRSGHSFIVWTEGINHDGDAGESYDHVANIAQQRIRQRNLRSYNAAAVATGTATISQEAYDAEMEQK